MKIRRTELKRLVEEVISEKEEGADKMYKERRKEIDRLVKSLQTSLKKMDAKQKKDPKNYGYAGSAGRLVDEMKDMLQSLS
tara:strand:+ start:203 stop:445 length:243 start_codon:yes stop_codon:yes gene_type:complete